jgi:hypothetical protein
MRLSEEVKTLQFNVLNTLHKDTYSEMQKVVMSYIESEIAVTKQENTELLGEMNEMNQVMTQICHCLYEGISRNFWTGCLEQELQMVQLFAVYHYFMSQSSEFCHHNPLCCFSVSECCCLFHYQLSLETFGYTLVYFCITEMRNTH